MSISMLQLILSTHFTSSLCFIYHNALVIAITVISTLTAESTSNSTSTCAFSLCFIFSIINWVVSKMKRFVFYIMNVDEADFISNIRLYSCHQFLYSYPSYSLLLNFVICGIYFTLSFFIVRKYFTLKLFLPVFLL